MTSKVGGEVTEGFAVRLLRGALAVAFIVTAGMPAVVRAQEEPPLEDVTLRGRILRPDGKPLANTAVRVDAVEDDGGFAWFSFFFTFGFSTLACFGGDELCPFSDHSTRYDATTDANGRYSFTFPDAHYAGEQTNTDYYLSVAMPSRAGSGRHVVASYELELWDAVHDAPDLVMWDPSLAIKPGARTYGLSYELRKDSRNDVKVFAGDKDLGRAVVRQGDIDARGTEDQAVTVVLNASRDERAARTIYHQRFVSAPYALKGTLVPLSRGARCIASRENGAVVGTCKHTDGDLTSPGYRTDEDVPFDCRFPDGFRPTSPTTVNCPSPINTVTVDLGAAKEVGAIDSRCGCKLSGSVDGTTWEPLPESGTLGAARSLRFVRATGSIAASPELSVWPPDAVAPTPLVPDTTEADDDIASRPNSSARDDDDGADRRPWLLTGVALVTLVGAGYFLGKARREAV